MAYLKAAIVVMSVLIVAGVIAVIWRIADMGSEPPVRDLAVELGLAPGCAIEAAQTDAGLLTVTVGGGPDCGAAYVIDLASGQTVAVVRANGTTAGGAP